jgi:hypothetical protein
MAVHVHNAGATLGDDDGGGGESGIDKMSELFGPGHVDQSICAAIQACWMALPKERRTVDEVEKQIRRITDRALSNFREDAAAFGR